VTGERRSAGSPPGQAAHYSYTHYAEPVTAKTFDQRRFSGPIGMLVAESQERVLLGFLGEVRDRDVLDVGTGTGRAALAIARRGGRVVGIDASAQMLAVARERAAAEGVTARFEPGDAHSLAFADRTFDAAVSLRVLMHTPDWRRCLGELCRVARSRVIFDYPALLSVAALQAVVRRAWALLGKKTEAYRVLSDRAIGRELQAQGFRVTALHRQFVLPIALHKLVGSRRFTEAAESLLARTGLLRLVGSPVTVVADRCAS
jgi:ubiquinone/menaquinone biosynthesis C-methylase UbiE